MNSFNNSKVLRMNRLLVFSLVLPSLVGCGAGIAGLPDTRLDVSDELRTNCIDVNGTSLPDSVIEAVISEVETFRKEGTPKSQILETELFSCVAGCDSACDQLGPDTCSPQRRVACKVNCGPCMTSIVDQVYGQ
jgi:hypothetical protein